MSREGTAFMADVGPTGVRAWMRAGRHGISTEAGPDGARLFGDGATPFHLGDAAA